jgi:hypothetical protein
MGVNTVYLQAFSDPDANGSADMVYFPNRHIPMRADLFNRVAWQIQTRTPVSVFMLGCLYWHGNYQKLILFQRFGRDRAGKSW